MVRDASLPPWSKYIPTRVVIRVTLAIKTSIGVRGRGNGRYMIRRRCKYAGFRVQVREDANYVGRFC